MASLQKKSKGGMSPPYNGVNHALTYPKAPATWNKEFVLEEIKKICERIFFYFFCKFFL